MEAYFSNSIHNSENGFLSALQWEKEELNLVGLSLYFLSNKQ